MDNMIPDKKNTSQNQKYYQTLGGSPKVNNKRINIFNLFDDLDSKDRSILKEIRDYMHKRKLDPDT